MSIKFSASAASNIRTQCSYTICNTRGQSL